MNNTSLSSTNRYYVYTLLSLKDREFFTGLTTDLKTRLLEHSKGMVLSTRVRIPFKLIHYEYFTNYDDAIQREKYLKTNIGRAQLKQSLKQTLNRINPYNFLHR